MRYTSFQIEKYKGVRNTSIGIPRGSSNAVTLIGLNESGKSDYAILRGLTEGKKLPFKIVPAHGATTLGALIGLLRGWGWQFSVLLDSDKEGKEAAEKYQEQFAIGEQLFDLESVAKGPKEIEDLLTPADRQAIADHVGVSGKLSKKQIYNFFVKNADHVKSFDLRAAKGESLKRLLKAISGQFG